jgi:hypothetical protein
MSDDKALKDLTEKLDTYVQKYRIQESLEKIESYILNLPVETGYFIDLNGNTVFSKSGDDFGIAFTKPELTRLIKYGELIFTHNHPRMKNYGDIIASPITHFDIGCMCLAQTWGVKVIEARAVCNDYIYSVKPGPQGWPSPNQWDYICTVKMDKYHNFVLKSKEFRELIQGSDLPNEMSIVNLLYGSEWPIAAHLAGVTYQRIQRS